MDSAIGNMQQKQPGSEAPDEAARNLQSARAAAANFLGAVTDSMLSATIDAQGTYIVTGVPPGTYFLHVKAPGYVDTLAQFSAQDLATTDPTLRKRIFATVATVTISGDEQVREDLRLERGAALTGRLRYDDGSPATGWTVTALLKRTAADGPAPTIFGIELSGLPIAQKLDHTLSDENGRFHIAGLPTGDYVLQANFTTAALDRQPFAPVASSSGSFLSILGGISALSGLRLSIYSGNTVHVHDAEVLSLRAGEERGVADLTVPLSSTRCISGILLAGADGHPLNSGAVQLIGQDSDGHDDPSLHFSADVRPDGTFRFDNVPAPSAYKLLSVARGRHLRRLHHAPSRLQHLRAQNQPLLHARRHHYSAQRRRHRRH